MTPAVFLDRDGTMIQDAGYLAHRDDLRWFPWTLDAIRLLGRAGYRVFVVTNQGGIGLGRYPESFVLETHAHMDAEIRSSGGFVHGWFYCPHHPAAVIPALRVECRCRKPGPGMVEQAARTGAIDFARSHVIGDKIADAGLAQAVGATGWVVRTGHGRETTAAGAPALPAGTRIVADLSEAVARILHESGEAARS
jgi:D-glycero-D-manno-heptose 1,7-bisphosphate phosphatase